LIEKEYITEELNLGEAKTGFEQLTPSDPSHASLSGKRWL
jgi:hypothetical protein